MIGLNPWHIVQMVRDAYKRHPDSLLAAVHEVSQGDQIWWDGTDLSEEIIMDYLREAGCLTQDEMGLKDDAPARPRLTLEDSSETP